MAGRVLGTMPNVARVAILTPYLPSSRPGGVEVFTRELAAALGGAQVFAPTRGATSASAALSHLGLEQPVRALEPARAFREAHRGRPFDLVISNGLCGWPLAFAGFEGPAVQVYHFTFAGLAQKALPRGDRLTTGRITGFFDRLAGTGKTVVAVSESVQREVSRLYGYPSLVLPNGVDVDLFRRKDQGEARDAIGLPRGPPVGLFVGRSERAKGFDLVQAVAQTSKDIHVACVSQPAPAPGNVSFFPDVPHERMPWFYSAADFLLLPSRYEGFNLSLLEALACDLPIVTSAAAYPFGDGPPRLATVVDPLTRDGLVQAIRGVLERGRPAGLRDQIVQEYSLDAFRRRWVELVHGLVAGQP